MVWIAGFEPAASWSRTRRAANCATAACVPLMPPAVRRGRSPPEPPRWFFARRDATRMCEGGIWRKVSALTTLTWTGKGPGAGMPPAPAKTPEPQSCAPLEEVTGVEPASPGWEPGILTDRRYLHVGNGLCAVPCVSVLCSLRPPGRHQGPRQAEAGRHGIAEPPAFLRATAPPQYRPVLALHQLVLPPDSGSG